MLPRCYLCQKEVTPIKPFATGRFRERYYLLTSICENSFEILGTFYSEARRFGVFCAFSLRFHFYFLSFSTTQVALMGERVDFIGKGRLRTLSSACQISQIKTCQKIRNRSVHIGCIVPCLLVWWTESIYHDVGYLELLILTQRQCESPARGMSEQSTHVFPYNMFNSCIQRPLNNHKQ